MEYNKKDTFKEGRKLGLGRGPRDLQRRQQLGSTPYVQGNNDASIINELRKQINLLTEALVRQSPGVAVTHGYSEEEFNSEVIKAVDESVSKVRADYDKQIIKLKEFSSGLKNSVSDLQTKLANLKTANINLKNERDDLKNKQVNLESRINELETALTVNKPAPITLQDILNHEVVTKLDKELQRMENVVTDYEKERLDMLAKIKNEEENNLKLMDEVKALKNSLIETKERCSVANKQIDVLNNKLDNINNSEDVYQKERKEFEKEISRLKAKPSKLEPVILELDKTKKEIARMSKDMVAMESRSNALNKENIKLEKDLAVMQTKLDAKDETIEALKNRPVFIEGEAVVESGRPDIEQVYIDPLSAEDKIEKEVNIDIKVTKSEQKEQVDQQVNKLKSLLGGLPKRS